MDDDQEKFLEEGKRNVKENAFYMRQAIDNSKLRDVLKYAANMLGELRTLNLNPKNYYILFMQIFDEMRHVEQCFKDEYKKGRKMSDLYENVQHAQYILPRLYLLVTVGSVYISTKQIAAKDILSDLMEMMKGVQHPVKGLFLRYYFLKLCKDRFPDKGSDYEGEGGDFSDALNVVLSNLGEMNKLWIRMVHTSKQERAKRDKDRNDLRVTVGENIVRISQFEGCSVEVYKEFVLDKLIAIITAKEDKISQQYLLDCIIQAFPDEYHIQTLEKILDTCSIVMQNNVDIKTIFVRLMDRLSDFAANTDEDLQGLTEGLDLYDMFKSSIDKIIDEQGHSLELSKFMELQVAFLKFSNQCYPDNVEYVNDILKSCCKLLSKKSSSDIDETSLKQIVKLLTNPLNSLSIQVLDMEEFPKLMKYLPFLKRRTVSLKIALAVANSSLCLDNLDTVEQIITFISPLLKDGKDYVDLDPYEFEEEQLAVAKLVHLVYDNNPNEYFGILEYFREKFKNGGQKRQFYTYPSLLFAYMKFARYLHKCKTGAVEEVKHEETEHKPEGEEEHENHEDKEGEDHEGEDHEGKDHEGNEEKKPEEEVTEKKEEKKEDEDEDDDAPKKQEKIYNVIRKPFKGEIEVEFRAVFDIMKEIIEALSVEQSERCLKYYLELIGVINECDPEKELDEDTYDLFTKVLEIYQNDISDADQKVLTISLIGGALEKTTCMSEDNYDGIAGHTASSSGKLLKKYDQCLAVLSSTHLFFNDHYKNETRVMECFKKALKITDAQFNSSSNAKNFHLYLAILNKFLYFFDHDDFTSIKPDDVNKCLEMIKGKLEKVKDEKKHKYLNATYQYINIKKGEKERYGEINI